MPTRLIPRRHRYFRAQSPTLRSFILLASGLLAACVPLPRPADDGGAGLQAFVDGRPVKEYQLGHRAVMTPNYPRCAPRVISEYGVSTDPTGATRSFGPHNGIDIGRFGDDVLAMADGVVSQASGSQWGNSVLLYHGPDKDGLHLYTSYGHLQEMTVGKGDAVRRGQKIGIVGHSGRAAGPLPHVHVMVSKYMDDRSVGVANLNPHRFWLDGPGKITCFDSENSLQTDPSRYQGDDKVNGIRLTYPLRCDCSKTPG